jgi:hypothetical protein
VIETLAGLTLRDGWADCRRGDFSTRVSLAFAEGSKLSNHELSWARSELGDAPRPLLSQVVLRPRGGADSGSPEATRRQA